MKIERAEIERLLALAEQRPQESYAVHGLEVVAVCRAWLALDAAPVGVVVGQSGPFLGPSGAVVQMDDPASVKGQRVRLVATPTTRGRDE